MWNTSENKTSLRKANTMAEMKDTDYWLSFVSEWDRLARVAHSTGQRDVAAFFDELADDAGDMWAHLSGNTIL